MSHKVLATCICLIVMMCMCFFCVQSVIQHHNLTSPLCNCVGLLGCVLFCTYNFTIELHIEYTSCALWASLATVWSNPDERRIPGRMTLIGGRNKQQIIFLAPLIYSTSCSLTAPTSTSWVTHVLFVATPMNWEYMCTVCGHYLQTTPPM